MRQKEKRPDEKATQWPPPPTRRCSKDSRGEEGNALIARREKNEGKKEWKETGKQGGRTSFFLTELCIPVWAERRPHRKLEAVRKRTQADKELQNLSTERKRSRASL